MTNRELNASIKAELKKAGYNVRDFSVSVKDAGYSTAVHVTVKTPFVRLDAVERLLTGFSSYERDTVTGEILQGGNTYVFTEYDDTAFDLISIDYYLQAAVIMEDMLTSDGRKVAGDDEKSLHIINAAGELRLSEFSKSGGSYSRWVRSSRELAKMLFDFDTFGTIKSA
ncbi:MAG: hypothetical protein LIO57_08315 [Oscillospiraceae bacterium]|nr:hypothetical protein [Oscillospiraceae bacterium]